VRYRRRDVDAVIWQHHKRSLDLDLIITDAQGRVVFATAPEQQGRDFSRWNDIYLTLRGEYGARATRADPGDPATSVMHVAAPVYADDDLIGVVSLSKPAGSVAPIIADSRAAIRTKGLLLLAAAALIGLLFTWHLTRAIERLRRYARAVTEGRRGPPPRSGARELAELADALDEMRTRLEGKQTVERYLHTLTHELKSPLAAIRGAAELLGEPDMPAVERGRFLDNIRSQSDRLTQVAERLLELARVEQQQVLGETEPLDAAALVRELAEAARPLAEGRGIRIVVDAPEPAPVRADRFLLGRALANLIDNAVGFSPDDGEVRIRVRSASGTPPSMLGQVVIEVEDQGPGIPEYARGRVFERFFSLPRRPGGPKGTGLGLSFAREVAELHGGMVMLRSGQRRGALATLRLPRSTTG
jgi:two-component system sensor histidine kinase CreC